ncbi:hypothetical protein [Blastococcus sp. TF02A-30]|uniref:hypothetical protein n=1 Tax=Blastococcus sp. TF02A-30 TaxID=2250580 RepID=UPI000DE8D8F1|nr:hypothetical protein [Blastococcus sp. TF02A-30]RBY85735.1 hypothetical protein DQ241_15750 [Blastococcus sp. TF02A-30]
MTQRLHPRGSRRRRPLPPPPYPPPESEPTILGFPAETGEGTAAAPAVTLTAVRRPDRVAAGALVLAGAAANVSLVLSWSSGEEPTGLSLVERGGQALESGVAESVGDGDAAPLVVVVCGGLLLLLGLLLLVPAHAHRTVGLLALVVASAATAAVLVVVADAGWRVDRFGAGTWCAVAVAALGLLGALKAMLTPPLVTLAER